MASFIVTHEICFNGEDIRVFRSRESAENYMTGKDVNLFDSDVVIRENIDEVYVVIVVGYNYGIGSSCPSCPYTQYHDEYLPTLHLSKDNALDERDKLKKNHIIANICKVNVM